MNTTEKIHSILEIDESYKAPSKIFEILLGDKKEREQVFNKFGEAFGYNFSYDWFHEYFEEEHADRKEKKQDFTPNSVAELLTKIAYCDSENVHSYFECACGTGGIVIADWWQIIQKHPLAFLTYEPSEDYFFLEELSDRAIPFLLLNLMIRGMNATVIHGDSLERTCKGIFYLVNESNSHMWYSSLNVMPYSDDVAEYFKVKFTDFRYPEHVETVLDNER